MALSLEIPDNVRQALRLLAKYHFWILAAVVPAIAIPALFAGTAALATKMEAERRRIDAAIGQLKAVTTTSPHPNSAWTGQIDAQAARLSGETLAEWQGLWDGQQSLRVWPGELGQDFLAAVAERGPTGRLERPLLLRYQKLAPRLARGLPARMGAADEMTEATTPPAGGGPAGDAMTKRPLAKPELAWSTADQRRVYQNFVWEKPPSTPLVILAQEELWVYGTLCDLVKQFNAQGEARGRELAIATVETIAIGHDAVEGRGTAGDQRIFVPAPDGGRDGMPAEPPPPLDPGLIHNPEAPVERPTNPRFRPGGKAASDDGLRNWIYVGFNGVPLSAAELATSLDARMVHLMPFVLQITIDQREVDAFVAACAGWPVPLDVRQVRINPQVGGSTPLGGGGSGESPPTRRLDMRLELHGTVGLATPPVRDAGGSGGGRAGGSPEAGT